MKPETLRELVASLRGYTGTATSAPATKGELISIAEMVVKEIEALKGMSQK